MQKGRGAARVLPFFEGARGNQPTEPRGSRLHRVTHRWRERPRPLGTDIRAAVAEIEDRLCFHPPLESDAREEKSSYKHKAESGKPTHVSKHVDLCQNRA